MPIYIQWLLEIFHYKRSLYRKCKILYVKLKYIFWKYSSQIENKLIHSSTGMLFREKLWEAMQFWLKIIKEMMHWQ